MIGPAEIEDMMAEYADAVAAGDEEALVTTPVWPVSSPPTFIEPIPSRPHAVQGGIPQA